MMVALSHVAPAFVEQDANTPLWLYWPQLTQARAWPAASMSYILLQSNQVVRSDGRANLLEAIQRNL
jgi:hypothetical protein